MAGVIGSVDALTRGLAVDLAPIRVNVVCPGFVKTEVSSILYALHSICSYVFNPLSSGTQYLLK